MAQAVTPPTITLELPLISQSQNAYQRSHWLDRYKLVGRYRRLVGHRLNELLSFDPDAVSLWPRMPDKRSENTPKRDNPARRRLVITRHSAGELDYGNLVGGCKPLVDALVREGLLYDDSPKWLDESYLQAKTTKGRGRVVVEVWA